MTELGIYALCNRYRDTQAIDSEEKCLQYIVDKDKKGVIITGYGMTLLSIRQAKAVCRELPGVLEDLGYRV